VIVTVGSMASLIVLNSKSRCSVIGFGESKAVAMAVPTGAAVFEVDLDLRLAFVVAFTLVVTTRCCIASIALVCQNIAFQMVALNTLCL